MANYGVLGDVHGGYTNIFHLDGHADSFDKDSISKKYYPKMDEFGADNIKDGNMVDPDDID